MILPQLWREFAVRSLLWWIPISAIMGVWMSAMGARDRITLSAIPTADWPCDWYAAIFLWMVLSIYLLNAGFSSRCSSRIDTVLPLPARRLWLVHMSAIVLPGVAIPALITGAFAMATRLQGLRPLVEPGVVSLALHVTVGMILALAILQSPRPSLHDLPFRRGYLALMILTVVGFLGLVLLLGALPRVYALAPLGLALILGLRVYLLLPKAFALVPLAPEPAARPKVPGAVREGRPRPVGGLGSRWLLFSTIWRSPFGSWTWLYFPLFALYGVMLSLFVSMKSWHEQAFTLILFTSVILCCWHLVSMSKLHVLDPLPISRRWMFAVLVAPALLTVMLGYGGGLVGADLLAARRPQVDFTTVNGHECVVVPGEFWEVAWDGELPEVRAPWGESARPCCGLPLFRGSRTLIYKSYHTPLDRSREFVALQIGRAIEAVYGEQIPSEEIRDRYLETDQDGNVRLGDRGFALLEDYPGLRTRHTKSAHAVVTLLVGLPWLVFVAITYRAGRRGTARPVVSFTLAALFVLAMAAGIGALMADAAGLLNLTVLSRLLGILVRKASEAVPAGPLTIWGISALLLLGGYLAAQAQFQRLEISVRRDKK
jgi:hypothetical protein